MIVRNEEARLGSCLKSVKNFVDEMVVVDTGSTDLTVSVAKSEGARVEYLPWPGDFAPARNEALKLVQGDWVLVLDADEQLLPDCISELRLLMSRSDTLVINLLRYEKGALMSPYSYVSRLFRKHSSISWSRPYHSTIDESVLDLLKNEPQWRICDCVALALTHDGYQPELIQSNLKAKKLRDAMENWLLEYPGDPYACAKLGALEVTEGSRDRGLKLLKEGLSSCEGDTSRVNEHYELLLHLGIALSRTNPEEAVIAYRKALELPMDSRASLGARLNLASLLMKSGDLETAFLLTKSITNSSPELALGWFNLGLIYRYKGNLNQALSSYERAIALNSSYVEAHQNIALVKFLLGNIDGAREDFKKVLCMLADQGRTEEEVLLRKQLRGMINLDKN